MSVFTENPVVRSRELVGRDFAIDHITWRNTSMGEVACTIDLTLDDIDGPQARWLPSSGVCKWLWNRERECREKGEELIDRNEWLTLESTLTPEGKVRYLLRPAEYKQEVE